MSHRERHFHLGKILFRSRNILGARKHFCTIILFFRSWIMLKTIKPKYFAVCKCINWWAWVTMDNWFIVVQREYNGTAHRGTKSERKGMSFYVFAESSRSLRWPDSSAQLAWRSMPSRQIVRRNYLNDAISSSATRILVSQVQQMQGSPLRSRTICNVCEHSGYSHGKHDNNHG